MPTGRERLRASIAQSTSLDGEGTIVVSDRKNHRLRNMMVIVLVVQHGQTETGGTIKLLKELPVDVCVELMHSVLDQQ
jgi:hypothetical protein